MLGEYPVGDRIDCLGRATCEQAFDYAVTWLDGVEPGHPAVVGYEAYRLLLLNEKGEQLLMARSGGGFDGVLALLLEDGSSRVRFVWCGAGVDPDICGTSSMADFRQFQRGFESDQ